MEAAAGAAAVAEQAAAGAAVVAEDRRQEAAGAAASPPDDEVEEVYPQFGPCRNPTTRPLHKMTATLIVTYKRINALYHEMKAKEREQQGKPAWDDEHHDYILIPGEEIRNRYVVRGRIGKGSFGQVVKCMDKETGKDVAMKIIKSKKPFKVQSMTEVAILKLIRDADKDNRNHHGCVRLLANFEHRGHPCLVFEQLSYNLYELLKYTKFRGVSLDLIHKFARQMLETLRFLSEKLDIIHCDLKPENILLCQPKRSAIKVIDFGSSCKTNKKMYSYIQSRFYRSPEVLLGVPYTAAIDIWSLGCILVEMHTGEPLFGGSDSHDQLYRIQQVLGPLPYRLIRRGTKRDKYYTSSPPPNAPTTANGDHGGSGGGGDAASAAPHAVPSHPRPALNGAVDDSALAPAPAPALPPPVPLPPPPPLHGYARGKVAASDDATDVHYELKMPSRYIAASKHRAEQSSASSSSSSSPSSTSSAATAATVTAASSDTDTEASLSSAEGGAAAAKKDDQTNETKSSNSQKAKAQAATGAAQLKVPPPKRKLSDIIGVATGGPKGRRNGERGHTVAHYLAFLDLVRSMLRVDPEERVTPATALKHRFLQQELWADTSGASSSASSTSKPAPSADDDNVARRRVKRPPSRGMYTAATVAVTNNSSERRPGVASATAAVPTTTTTTGGSAAASVSANEKEKGSKNTRRPQSPAPK